MIKLFTPKDVAARSNETLDEDIWESYYALHGVKPRHMDFQEMSREDKVDNALFYLNACIREMNAEEQRKKDKMKKANRKALEARRFDKKFNSLAMAFA